MENLILDNTEIEILKNAFINKEPVYMDSNYTIVDKSSKSYAKIIDACYVFKNDTLESFINRVKNKKFKKPVIRFYNSYE